MAPRLVAKYHSIRVSRAITRNKLSQTPHGFLFIGHKGMQSGCFEPSETNLLSKLLKKDIAFINVGSNFGYYVCMAKKRTEQIVAIEPSPLNIDIFYKNLAANSYDSVELYPIAASNSVGFANLYGGGTSASLIRGWAGMSTVWKSVVPTNTLDNLLGDRFENKSKVILIDVEGSEYPVLEGARKLVSSDAPTAWMVEISFSENRNGELNENYYKTFRTFLNQNYIAFNVNDNTEIMLSHVDFAESNGIEISNSINYVFYNKSWVDEYGRN